MSDYRIPWVPIRSEADLPPVQRGVYLGSWPDKRVHEVSFVRRYRDVPTWETEETAWEWHWKDAPIAWAPLPAPYDPDAPKPADEVAALRTRCARLAAVVRAIPSDESYWLCESAVGYRDARFALKSGDLEVSE